jgi:HSP20 family molecular chaperone IbpA
MGLAEQTARPRLVPVDEALDRMNALYQLIARRAFEIFEYGGCNDGHDLEDWFRAEGELFHESHLAVEESADALAVRAEVPGFGARDLQVCVEPRRLIITGKRRTQGLSNTRRLTHRERCSDRIFRLLDCRRPVEYVTWSRYGSLPALGP